MMLLTASTMATVSPHYLAIGILVMAAVTFFTRAVPIILPKRWLDSPLLLAINKSLPLSVMTLLILTSLSWHQDGQSTVLSELLLAQVLALVMVLLSYHVWRQLFISMVIGIASLNGLLVLLS